MSHGHGGKHFAGIICGRGCFDMSGASTILLDQELQTFRSDLRSSEEALRAGERHSDLSNTNLLDLSPFTAGQRLSGPFLPRPWEFRSFNCFLGRVSAVVFWQG